MSENNNINNNLAEKLSVFRTAAVLSVIAVITVSAISLLNLFAGPVIERRLLEEKREAIIKLFRGEEAVRYDDSIKFEELTEFEDLYLDFGAPVTGVFLVTDEHKLGDDKTAGYCVMTAPRGFTDSIIMLVAVNSNLTVKDTLILSMSETVGYGTKIDGDENFREQFKNKTLNIRDSRNKITPGSGENAVQIIAGATVSSKAFVRGVNAALDIVKEISVRTAEINTDTDINETGEEDNNG
ncbi:MAG: FMN-binding protein [Oscillospiraceae bacterium]|nr:FMN-binding protein [Oscillospiraceae bacterium]